MGTLYHLADEDARRRAVRQAARKLRAGGVIFAVFITRFAPLRDLAARDPGRLARAAGLRRAPLAHGGARLRGGVHRGLLRAPERGRALHGGAGVRHVGVARLRGGGGRARRRGQRPHGRGLDPLGGPQLPSGPGPRALGRERPSALRWT
ncbi:hypothetical protein [Oceanithermus sp.]